MAGIFERISSGIAQVELAKIKRRLPGSVQKSLPLARKLLYGGTDALLHSGIDMLMERYGVIGGPGSRIPGDPRSLLQPTELLGGITLKQARQMFDECMETSWQKRNLWFINITNISGGLPFNLNLFATDVGYTGFNTIGDPIQIGSGFADQPIAGERREIRVTTMDDQYGSAKRWFKDRYDRMIHRDGTVGLPIEYLFRVSIIHARVTEQLSSGDDPFIDSFIVRPGSIENELSRREDSLAEYQMSFVQSDTFTGLA